MCVCMCVCVMNSLLKLVVRWSNSSFKVENHWTPYKICHVTIYPTPPLGQDMTQGQILSGV